MPLLALLLSLVLLLGAEGTIDYSDEPSVNEKVLYSSLMPLPKSLYQGQIFAITFKTLSTETHFQDIDYAFSGFSGIKRLSDTPFERYESPYYYHTFYFQVTGLHVRLPDTHVSLVYSDFLHSDPIMIPGKNIEIIKLNPPKDFAHIIADSLQLMQYKANPYDKHNNIALFTLQSDYAVIDDFKISNGLKQGFESNESRFEHSSFTYYTLVPKHLQELRFTYFNMKRERFEPILIPIIVDDDTVSTQSDLKPRDHRHTKLKLYIALAFAALSLLLFAMRRKFFYLVVMLAALIYSALNAIPTQHACVKAGAPITLLPMHNATVFETTDTQKRFVIEGSIKGYVKIKLNNNHIGWVKHDDLCTP